MPSARKNRRGTFTGFLLLSKSFLATVSNMPVSEGDTKPRQTRENCAR